ncbi:hypothetical protein RJT34_11057 [Clitoria ternatea]|uniref:Uncharacterized protein n=1 Tax=Clitoria ternatea TaxID=43366 RepID=A0AAN9JLQ2_CLITE
MRKIFGINVLEAGSDIHSMLFIRKCEKKSYPHNIYQRKDKERHIEREWLLLQWPSKFETLGYLKETPHH